MMQIDFSDLNVEKKDRRVPLLGGGSQSARITAQSFGYPKHMAANACALCYAYVPTYAVSLRKDPSPHVREVKIPLYASTGIPEVWLIDLARKAVEVYRQPSAQGYREVLRPHPSEPLKCALLPQVSLFPAEFWPKRE